MEEWEDIGERREAERSKLLGNDREQTGVQGMKRGLIYKGDYVANLGKP